MQITQLKNDAKLKVSGNFIKCASSSLLYFIIFSLLTFFQNRLANIIESSIILAIIQAFFILIYWILNMAIIANILDLVNIKTNSITEFINTAFKNFFTYTKLALHFLLKIIWPLILNLFVTFYWIGTAIAKKNKLNFLCFHQNLLPLVTVFWFLAFMILIYHILKYILIPYIYHDTPEMALKDILEKSNTLMKKNKFAYISLLLSFLHWFLLVALVLLILNSFIPGKYLTTFIVFFCSLIKPYIITAKEGFYQELKNKEEETKEPVQSEQTKKEA